MLLRFYFVLLSLSTVTLGFRNIRKSDIHERQAKAAKRFESRSPLTEKRAQVQNITFSNPKASGESDCSAT